MPTYTTSILLRARLDPVVLAGLADDVNTPPDIEDEQTRANIGKAIEDGAALMDSILGAQLDLAGLLAEGGAAAPLDSDWLPGTAAQRALERLNATLALYFLFQRRCLDDRMNPLAAARELAEAHLRAVARGAATLGGTLDSMPSKTVWSSTEGREQTVSQAKLERF